MNTILLLAFSTVVQPLAGEKWWGGVVNNGDIWPHVTTPKPRNLAWFNGGGTTSPFLVSSCPQDAGATIWGRSTEGRRN